MSEPIHIISLGAVQSSAMALMAAEGELQPQPAFAVFADTGSEPKRVYEWVERLANLLPFPVHTCHSHHGPLHEQILRGNFSQIPAWTIGANGKPVMGKKQCTNHWKLRPINKAIREHTSTTGKPLSPEAFHVWKGISTDEAARAKDSTERCQKAVFPLLDNFLSREHCRLWLTHRGHPTVKSACVFCPYRSDLQWSETKRTGGSEWDMVVAVDRKLAQRGEFLHRACKPIEEVNFDRAHREDHQLNLFNNDCVGYCGV